MSGASASECRVLLVEDEPAQSDWLGGCLSAAGYEVHVARNGAEALARILQGDIQILITDLYMPAIDGLTLCRRLREMPLPGYLYIFLLTSYGSTTDIVAGLEAGADDYLKKPADPAELLARLKAGRRVIELERSLREAHTKLREMTVTDPLLGIYNRRFLMEEMPREIERARRYNRPLSVVMADLDHFKGINDEYGHQTGDMVLVSFAQIVRSCIRRTDWVARAGGEEFVIVLPETDLTSAAAVAEKIRGACVSMPLMSDKEAIHLTASFGVSGLRAGWGEPLVASEWLLRQADDALYSSKRSGRNRVSLARQARIAG